MKGMIKLKWNKVIGYDKNLAYDYQRENKVNLPEIGKLVLIYYHDKFRYNDIPFVGYIKYSDTSLNIYDSEGRSMMLLEYAAEQNLQWAEFDMPERDVNN